MSTTAVAAPATRRIGVGASLRRNRRWALITSYVFLIMFAIFFLLPPYYMIVTSLKSDAEDRADGDQPMVHLRRRDARSVQDFAHPDRLPDFFQKYYDRHCVRGGDHYGGERTRCILARPHEILGLEHSGNRHFPHLPGARHVVVHPAVPDRQIDRPAQFLLGHGAGLSDADGAVLHLDHDWLFPVDSEGAR